MAKIVALVHYPVKGCAGIEITDGLLSEAGLGYDRTFMIVDSEGGFLSQRKDPRLALVRPAITGAMADLGDVGAATEVEDIPRLTLEAPGIEPFSLAVDPSGETGVPMAVWLHGLSFSGLDQGDEVAGWLSTVLNRPCRLVRVPPDHDRLTGGETPGTSGFADSSAVLAVSLQSLAELNSRLEARGATPVPVNRFRPNVVIDGWHGPHVEDDMRRFEVGQAELGFTTVAIRCAVTTVDQATGERKGPEPLRTLADYRRIARGVTFGAKFSVTRAGKVSVGDEVRVTRWAEDGALSGE
ncbi:MOSC domain-containing protein [Saccharomonospora xinjiangensis]|uniref:MOSC domain-containing protein n=1 Tax=Saccharomonospora xinjiangensis TaxID=75294 RepID=UPI0035105341